MKKNILTIISIFSFLISPLGMTMAQASTNPGEYHSSWNSQSAYLDLKTNETATIWIKFKNTGNTTWYNTGNYPIHLGTSAPLDRSSSFYSGSWLSTNRPATLSEASVSPGQIGTFTFEIKAPSQTGQYNEYFRPVAENLTWMEDNGVFIKINVNNNSINTAYNCQLYSQSEKNITLNQQKTQTIWAKFKNTGTATWYNYGSNPMHLATDHPQDRNSVFYYNSWLSQNRPAGMTESVVKPGEYGTFELTIKTPSYNGTYTEYFRPVAEGLTWLNDNNTYWYITVTTSSQDENEDDTSELNFAVNNTSNGIKLSWDEYNDDFDYYEILRSTSDSTPTYPSQSYKSISNYYTTEYTDKNVTDNTKYYYRLAVSYDDEITLYSDVISIIYNNDNEDDADINLEADSTKDGIELNWDQYEDNEDIYYVVLRSTTDSTPTYDEQYYDYIDEYYSTDYIDENVTDGKKYYYRIGIFEDNEIIAYSNIVQITYDENNNDNNDSSDLNFDITNISNGIKLTWDKYYDDFDSYKILRSTSDSTPTYPNQSYKSISNVSTTSYTDTNVDDGQKYYYRLAVYYDGEITLYSDIFSITYDEDENENNDDIDLEANNVGDAIELSWNEYYDESIDGYKILRSKTDSTPTFNEDYYDYVEDYDNTNYTDTSVTDGQRYYYRIGIYEDGEVTAYSNTVSIIYDEDEGNDFELTAVNDTNGVKLEWDEYNNDMDSYKILRSTSDNSPTYPNQSYTYINDENTTTYTDRNVEDNQKYYYRIGVYNNGDIVAYSNTVNITFDDDY